jgi:prophage regulatory protein
MIDSDLRIITEKEAATLCGISPDTLRRRIKAGTGPKRIRLSPRRVGFRLRDIREWQEANTETTAA